MKKEELKNIIERLKSYAEDQITFNEPHFTNQLILRDGKRDDVVNHLLKPDNLVYFSNIS